jgi:hypothetical protein
MEATLVAAGAKLETDAVPSAPKLDVVSCLCSFVRQVRGLEGNKSTGVLS